MNIIEKIKNEIERRSNSTSDTTTGRELDELLSFLDTLESEHLAYARKTSPKDLEEASSKFATYTAPNGLSVEFLEKKLSFQEGAKWQKEQDEEEFPKWKKIKAGERLPCPAYVWTIAYDNYPDCFEGRLIPNIQGVKVGRDTWYLPVDVIHNLPKEDDK